MALTNFDDNALVLALLGGVRDLPPWRSFLRALAQRTGADEAVLALSADSKSMPSAIRFSSRGEGAADAIVPMQDLRLARVYALDELLNYDSVTDVTRQKAVLAGHNIAFARLIRFAVPGGGSGSITLTAARQDFRAADSALLSLLAPFAGQAAAHFWALQSLRQEADVVQAAMARFGVAAFALDGEGRVLSMPAATEAALRSAGVRYDSARQSIVFMGADILAAACQRARTAPQWVAIGHNEAGLLLLPEGEHILAVYRQNGAPSPALLAPLLTMRFGLSRKEAQIAAALAVGETLAQAGQAAGLTAASTRMYSKRIFAKMGVNGQNALLRRIFSDALAAV